MEMTRNEYNEFCKECASKLYNTPGYSMADFKKDTDAVTIIPLDLSKYTEITDETKKWINALFSEEDTNRDGNYMLRGFTHREYAEAEKLNIVPEIYSNYSWHGVNDKEMLIYTYCEGDTTLTIFDDREKYDKEKAKTIKWYKETYAV